MNRIVAIQMKSIKCCGKLITVRPNKNVLNECSECGTVYDAKGKVVFNSNNIKLNHN